MITTKSPENWRDLQDTVAQILSECGFIVDIEKTVPTVRGSVEIDVYAKEKIIGRTYTIICECKNWKSNIPQSVIHSFRSVVSDIGANLGYLITSSGFQTGSINASKYTNIELVTWSEFQELFLSMWFNEFFSPKITQELYPLFGIMDPAWPPNWFMTLDDKRKDEFFELKAQYENFGWLSMSFSQYARLSGKIEIPQLPLITNLKPETISKIPDTIANETGYKELLELMLIYGRNVIQEFHKLKRS